MNCNHNFEGSANGVKCKICGLYLTAEEFISYLAKEPNNANKTVQNKTVKQKKN